MKKKILIVMLEAGAGHKMVATAVKQSIEKIYKSKYEIDIVDLAKNSGAEKDGNLLQFVWRFALRHSLITACIYRMLKIVKPTGRLYLEIFHRGWIKKSSEYIVQYKPDIIFSTHFFCTTLAIFAREKLSYPLKVISYISDPHETFSFWAEKKADFLCVTTDKCKRELIECGVDDRKILKIPYPIRREFCIDPTNKKERFYEDYKLNNNYYNVLATDGGEGIGNLYAYIKEVYKKELPFNIFIACGKNIKLYEKFLKLTKTKRSNTNLILLGFVSNINEYLDICDFSIGKSGPASVYESIIKNKPIIITGYSIGHEKATCDFIVDNKLGFYAKNKRDFCNIMYDAINTSIIRDYTKNIKKAGIISGSDQVAKLLVMNLDKGLKRLEA